MEESFPFAYPVSEFLMTLVGLVLFALDLVLDLQLLVSLYQEEDYLWMGVLLLLLLFSSLLVQLFSGFWYFYDKNQTEKNVLRCPGGRSALITTHVVLLAVPFRYIVILKLSLRNLKQKDRLLEGEAVYLNHDLSMLRLFETFSESAPQLVVMMSIIIQKGQLGFLTGLKAAGSAAVIAYSVAMYHRCMRSFLPEKVKQSYISSLAYFIWNLLLIGPRVVSMTLLASVLPGYLMGHFLILWLPLIIWAWLQRTDFMESLAGEWLYRGTVALIWYFSWLNVSHGSTQGRSIIYHGFMLVDMGILLWFWQEQQGEPEDILHVEPLNVFGATLLSYMLGLLLKVLYYKFLHPTGTELHAEAPTMLPSEDMVDFRMICSTAGSSAPGVEPLERKHIKVNKRMKHLAANFYSSSVSPARTPSAGGLTVTFAANGLQQQT